MSVSKEEIDSLDDLDDLLDDFDEDATLVSAPPPQPSGADTTLRQEPAASTTTDKSTLPTLAPDDFAKQLQSGMEDLMRELDTSPAARADFEQLMAQMNAATLDPSAASRAATSSYPNNPAKHAAASSAAPAAPSSIKAPKNFAESVEANLQRMKESSESQVKQEGLSSSTTTTTDEDAFMAEMMRQFQESAGGGEGGGGADFTQMLEGMMSQLMSKEILYEPLLELHQKYPVWLREHPKDEKIETYRAQARLVAQIIEKFEDSEYRDEDSAKKEEVMTLMSEMQNLGSPPPEIMSEDMSMLDPGKLDGDCCIM